MKDCTRRGELLFRWVCLVLVYSVSVESLNWTAQPDNPKELTEGQDVSLTWNYTLTADELTKSATFFRVTWRKFHSSDYNQLASYVKFTGAPPAYTEQAPHIVIDRATGTNSSTLHFNDVRTDDEGMYKIDISVEFPGTVIAAFQEVNLTVVVPSNIDYVSSDQVVCEGSMVTLSCNATGYPTPNITWTRAFDNGTDSAPLLPLVDEKYVINNIMRGSNGTYRCTADNGVGAPVNRTVRLTVRYSASDVRIVNSSNTVNEGGPFNMTCEASGDPEPNVRWIKVDNGQRIDGNILNFTNIKRNNAGEYRCEAENDCGSDSRVQSIEVDFKPDTVELLTNTTENTDCSDLWVNFTCNASEANPAVYNFLLYKKDGGISSSESGTWTDILTVGGKHVYNCEAQHTVENVNSSNIVTLTVNVPVSVRPIQDQIVEEGNSPALYCNASGYPDPTVTWPKNGGEAIIEGNWLNFTNINRSEAGQYKCRANNTCGPVSTLANIDVQYEPENVNLTANISSNKACQGMIVAFTCTSDANPAVDTYMLYENNVTIGNMDGSGVWKGPLNTSGEVIYRCEAINSVGTGRSNNITLNVEVPASVRPIQNKIVEEGNSTALYCDASGNPDPNVTWSKVGREMIIRRGNWLNFTSITKAEDGQYKCQANNSCGRVSTLANIDVHYKPENVQLNVNITKNKTCAGMKVNFTCTSDANPAVDNYKLYENDDPIGNMDRSGVWVMPLTTPGQFIYRCEANNSVGTGRSGDINVAVEVTVSVEWANIDKNVTEDENVELSCNASAGALSPTITWSKVGADVIIKGNLLNFTNINRSEAGQYKCLAINTCGNKSRVANINVQFGPSAKDIGQDITVDIGKSRSFGCPVDGNPEPTITWYNASGTVIYSGKTFNFPSTKLSDTGCYTCSAKNFLGTVNVTHCLVVEVGSMTTATPTTSNGTSNTLEITVKIQNETTDSFAHVRTEFADNVTKVFEHTGIENATITSVRNGCVIVDLLLRFNQSVSVVNVIHILKAAVRQGKFGNLNIDPDSIREITSPPPTSNTGSPKVQKCMNPSFHQDKHCKTKMWLVIVFVVAGVIVFAVVIALVTCMVYKRRKCRKDRKTHPPDDQEELQGNQSGADENAYSHVNGGYADSGPPSANGTDAGAQQPREGANGTDATGQQQLEQQVQGAPPTYAVVDKSTKKKKKEEEKKKKEEEKRKKEKEKKMKEEEKKNRNDSEQNIPQYAVVDKSQKKKKEVVEDAYAQVDMSKKSKKQKPKPGEMLYADLGEFQPRQMPAVSTSPAPLPPIKRPPAYEETQYADITQFLTGNATLPDANNSQGTEMTSANVEGGKEKPENTANEGGKEEKPKETRM